MATILPGQLDTFDSEEPTLEVETTGETAEGAVGADDAMAGDDDGDGVLSVGLSGGAKSSGAADFLGEPAIAAGLAVRDGEQALPDGLLEVRAPEEVEGETEPFQLSIEVSEQLPARFRMAAGLLLEDHSVRVPLQAEKIFFFSLERNGADVEIGPSYPASSEGALEGGVEYLGWGVRHGRAAGCRSSQSKIKT